MFVKKQHPGGSSHGYQWPQGGEWVEMPAADAHELVTIDGAEFEAQPELPKGAKAYTAAATGPAPGAPVEE
ncbi:hypothetical protein E6W39_24225 [Kitasatospora acidiphila]|uniref:Uncharacterized protein n=1 Tax=Kitasatospora acidiphila TaxID=2567942 RepID=A0A540W8S0_9ACTN|nr:hypothetical protein [Kitasatospora acidiphila]TQF04764.1 hypothetical protein E6W39_24225 [Kitasatospora acidiphila]